MWIRALALAAGALLLSAPVYVASPFLSILLIGVAGLSCIYAAGSAFLPRFKTHDFYDLNELHRLHEEEEIRALDPDGALGDPERVVCLRCMTDYPFRLRACPRCGLSR